MGGQVGKYNKPKTCPCCGLSFVRPFSKKVWEATIYCSNHCRGQECSVSAEVRFRRHISPPNENGCHIWAGTKIDSGYGHFRLTAEKLILAHRYAFVLKYGAIPDGLLACHRCDVRDCVNPDHIFLGTNQDNIDDRNRKNRQSRRCGTDIATAKLTPEDVRAIRSFCGPQSQAARRFGVVQSVISAISAIKLRKIWKHVS